MLLLLLGLNAADAKKVEVPVDVGVGPAAVTLFPAPPYAAQPWHPGLAISVEAVINKKTLRQNRKAIPKEYRQMVRGMDEVRISPSPLIPDTIWISPRVGDTLPVGLYGVTWRPMSVGVPLIKRKHLRVGAGAGLRLTVAVLHGEGIDGAWVFARPGLDGRLNAEVKLTDTVLISAAWTSMLHVPQPVDGAVWQVAPLDQAVWHVGQGEVKLHVRFPYTVNL
jgi:hypothetical protein